MPANYQPGKGMFRYQAPGLYSAIAVQNEWHALLGTCTTAGVVLTTVQNARVYEVVVACNVANETIEVQAVVDGEPIEAVSVAAIAGTNYVAGRYANALGQVDRIALATQANPATIKPFFIEGREVCVMVRKTTALGANPLEGIATWGQLSWPTYPLFLFKNIKFLDSNKPEIPIILPEPDQI